MYYSTFIVDQQLYAFQLGYVQEYAEALPYSSLPEPHGSIIGIGNLRGQIVSVLDLRHRLTGEFIDSGEAQFVVIRGSNNLEGVKVDFDRQYTSKEPVAIKVHDRGDVLEISNDKIKPCSSHGDESYRAYVKNMVEMDEQILLILDLQAILGCKDPEQVEVSAEA
jgi:purine-binding chemotaxis protein CheW